VSGDNILKKDKFRLILGSF